MNLYDAIEMDQHQFLDLIQDREVTVENRKTLNQYAGDRCIGKREMGTLGDGVP